MSEPFPCVWDHTLALPWDGAQSPPTDPLFFLLLSASFKPPRATKLSLFFSFSATFLGRVVYSHCLTSHLPLFYSLWSGSLLAPQGLPSSRSLWPPWQGHDSLFYLTWSPCSLWDGWPLPPSCDISLAWLSRWRTHRTFPAAVGVYSEFLSWFLFMSPSLMWGVPGVHPSALCLYSTCSHPIVVHYPVPIQALH